ncbi:MAG TPA: helix-turn-helix domain-containing protein [Pseudomonas xinjiangensis]|uniref:Helix-turn-helix domain-containing protein n=2 Tax=root TaxID=1 RepID=A0A7V1FRS8_9GAMM|nr:helix-turn-helix domain-containing protein [Halopseudomonas xinjiangensis]HEC46825.1 helix-turn-helix domain-containing protein [Halopseudomonas xinjiangensis]
MSADTYPSDIAARAARLGSEICAHRKALKVSATATAEISNISRVTLHRIEKGEASVSMAAYLRVLAALGLELGVIDSSKEKTSQLPAPESIPVRISLMAYPVLKSLAWQVHGTDSLTPQEAWDIYDRNWRHADLSKAQSDELALIESLRQVFGGGTRDV